jgi:UDP-glucose 6-dehydrogenase
MRVCVVGTGYVGLTTGVSLAFLGHQVTCVDLDQEKVDMLRDALAKGELPFDPAKLAGLIQRFHGSEK